MSTTDERIETPWDFSIPSNPREGVPNIPCEKGAELGREIARLTQVEEERQRQKFPNMLPMCDDCACRLGTPPNRTAATLMDLVKCTMERVPFYCHKGVRDEDEPKRLCAGYVLLVSAGER
jgi:hypothetical protein